MTLRVRGKLGAAPPPREVSLPFHSCPLHPLRGGGQCLAPTHRFRGGSGWAGALCWPPFAQSGLWAAKAKPGLGGERVAQEKRT